MSKHTPGPWFVDEAYPTQWDICKEHEDDWLVLFQFTPAIENIDNILTDEDKANARLTAAAPELLEALLNALPYVEDVIIDKHQLACFKPGVVEGHVKSIRAAIAKATGEPQ